jgi:hypothetical protein
MGEGRHWTGRRLYIYLWNREWRSSVRDSSFLYKKIISAVRRVEFLGDRMSYIILRGRWCSILALFTSHGRFVITVIFKYSSRKSSFKLPTLPAAILACRIAQLFTAGLGLLLFGNISSVISDDCSLYVAGVLIGRFQFLKDETT